MPNFQQFDWPLNGKLITSEDPLLLGEGNFQNLTNMRYTDRGIRGVAGMSKINSSAAFGYTSVDNGFHFKKDSPVQDAILVQTTSGSNSKIVKSATQANVPSTDTFADFQTLANNNRVYFTKAPDGAAVFCNGDTNYIWGGSESRCGKFVNLDPDGSFKYDYSDVINNTLTDAKNIATMHTVSAALDSNVMLLLHLDNNVTDSSPTTPHTVTNTNVTFSSSDKVFGTHSAVFNGTTAYLSAPDNADFDFSGGTWTVDGRFKTASLAGAQTIYGQSTDANNGMGILINTDGSVSLSITEAGVEVVALATPAGTISVDTWYHIEVSENGDNYYIFVGPTAGTATLMATTSDANRPQNYSTGAVFIGAGAGYFNGKIDEFRVSNTCRHTAAFSVPLAAYGDQDAAYVAIMSTRALQGVKFYIGTANATASSVDAFVWNGSAMTSVGAVTDGTASGGVSLAQTGSITFSDTTGTARVRYSENSIGYYYLFVFYEVDTTTTIYRCTVDAAVQSLTDIWDGSERTTLAFFKYDTAYSDLVTNIYERDYVSSSALTYAQIGGLTSSQYLYMGYSERITAIKFILPDSSYVNTTANTIITVSYWNGTAWMAISALEDGTSESAVSLAHSGVISWDAPDENTEFMTTVSDSDPYYFYRVNFSQTLTADVRLDIVTGIPAPVTLRPYRFPVKWQDRLWLLSDNAQLKNRAICSSFQTNCVFNGSDTTELDFGGDDTLVAAATLYSRFGSVLYDNLVVFKRNEIYLVDGSSPDDYRIYSVSQKIGCVAPLTVQSCDINYEVAPGVNKHVIVWQSAHGIEMFDGNTVSTLSDDISDFFNPTKTNYINPAKIDTFVGFYDENRHEYHWLCATGASTSLNREMVFDLRRRKWFEISRSKKLRCAFPVTDALGNKYAYGGTTDGYLERLENGTTSDGTAITFTWQHGDVPLDKTMMRETRLRNIKLTGVSKNTSTNTVAVTLYKDGASTGESVSAVSQADSAHRIYNVMRSVDFHAVFTGIKFSVSTNNETVGFEPLMVSGFYGFVREDR